MKQLLLWLATVATVVGWAACARPSPTDAGTGTSAATSATTSGAATEATPVAAPRADDLGIAPADADDRARACNVCYAHNWQGGGARGYGSATSAASLDELADAGMGAVSLTAFGWMSSLSSTEIRIARVRGSETFDRMRVDAERAHALGLEVMVKPHLWIGHGDWRGDIDPAEDAGGWDAWFDSYEAFILEHARFAASIDAAWFCVGVELVSSTRAHPDRWRALIAAIREVYDGRLVYAANWDEVDHVTFHDALDAVGVQHFAPLAEAPGADFATLRAASQRWLDRWSGIATEVDRPLVLTEVGFMNRGGGAVEPWVWPEHLPDVGSEAGDLEQRTAYLATLDTFGRADAVEQIYWWKWFSDPDTDEEGVVGFSPRGKPAGTVLQSFCAPGDP